MRILYHHRTRAEDAQGVHIQEMVKAFEDIGSEVDIVALVKRKGNNGTRNNEALLSKVARFVPDWLYELMSLTYNLYGYKNLYNAIKRKKPDLIYERYSLNTFCGIWASKRFGIPLILEVNAPLYHEQRQLGKLIFKKIARFSERWICSNSTKTIVVSQVMKEFLKHEGVLNEKIVVMPNGIDPNKFHPEISGEALRARYGFGSHIVIGFVGWFRKWHGLDMLLQTFKDIVSDRPDMRLLLVGDGPAAPELRKYAEENDLRDRVMFSGAIARDKIPEHIAAMDIAVQPSAPEYACPMKIIEYMAMGKCIIAPDQANIRELIDNGRTGLLFRARDRESLSAILREVIDEPQKREDIGRRAHASVFERGLLWQANARKTLSLVLKDK